MPNENPPRRAIFAEIETVLHALSIYGAAGIMAFGWAMGQFLGTPTAPWLPLWFCAALLIYNCDRLRRDPADALNIPHRAAACARWQPAICATLILSALILIGLPAWRRDWVILYLVVLGSLISLPYSIPVLGRRWKDVPLVKTIFAPTVVTAAVFGLLLFRQVPAFFGDEPMPSIGDFFSEFDDMLFLAAWAWCYLLFNMLLCDLRDHAGDQRCGIRSIPVILGEKGSRRLLWMLACAGQIFISIHLGQMLRTRLIVISFSLLTGLYQAWLLHATLQPRGERFYEWAVEGLLYLPAVACGLAWLLSRYILTGI